MKERTVSVLLEVVTDEPLKELMRWCREDMAQGGYEVKQVQANVIDATKRRKVRKGRGTAK